MNKWFVLITLLTVPLSAQAGEVDDISLDGFKLCVGCGKSKPAGAESATDDPVTAPPKLKLNLGMTQEEMRDLMGGPTMEEPGRAPPPAPVRKR